MGIGTLCEGTDCIHQSQNMVYKSDFCRGALLVTCTSVLMAGNVALCRLCCHLLVEGVNISDFALVGTKVKCLVSGCHMPLIP